MIYRVMAAAIFILAASRPEGTEKAQAVPGIVAATPPFLHHLFTDDMVLQRDASAPVWGWTEPGRKVAVEINGQRRECVAGFDGRWEVRVGPFPAGGPFTLAVSGPQTVTLHNVLLGDVWVCAGQSNMEFDIKSATGGRQAAATSSDDGLRLFGTPHILALEPRRDFAGAAYPPRWRVCSPAALEKGFSAVGYFFGRKLRRDLNVPVGLLQCGWGGSPAEAWAPKDVLAAMGDFDESLRLIERIASERAAGVTAEAQAEAWWRAHDPGTSASPGWADARFDDRDWKQLEMPRTWEEAGFPDFHGIVWLRRELDLPADWPAETSKLILGEIGNIDTVWINGLPVGATLERHKNRAYQLAPGLLQPGRNVVAIRVLNHGLGGFFDPGEFRLEALGRTPIALAGAWRCLLGPAYDAKVPFPGIYGVEPFIPTTCHNGMLASLSPFAIKGVIWYQGEANAFRVPQYRSLLPAVIADWRTRFACGEFPFLIVQLPNFGGVTEKSPGVAHWAEMREAQEQIAESVSHSGLAVTIDVGAKDDGHPPDKAPVGERLALVAEADVYGMPVICSGPAFRSVEFCESGASVRFAPNGKVGGGRLSAKGGALRGFSLAGADGQFLRAEASLDDNTVRVSSPAGLGKPTAVRYNWANCPDGNLYNDEGLPARPFRSDKPAFDSPAKPTP
ncbi:MAG: sialate O-acetylesterase [Verrucomicrobiae bacterium]